MRAFLILALLIAVVISAVAVVQTRHQHRQLFVALSDLEQERDDLNIEFGRMQLEQATWADPARIENLALNKLGMKYPSAEELRVVGQ
ncbi:cell division protein FtsL [Pseudoxanthomonas sp. CAU 1598]|uniref:Cell division protein FtsL n=1 Tax=Pseudomarimonas arenosa TaxID=2774145 RepID=A0AAW3ZH54_9GAMM|nr:cell division protein FtsL [Pseudomarimonas arenosa]MBD8525450.1 cell division protein FtsL [Pseudomarimonas arenosa]